MKVWYFFKNFLSIHFLFIKYFYLKNFLWIYMLLLVPIRFLKNLILVSFFCNSLLYTLNIKFRLRQSPYSIDSLFLASTFTSYCPFLLFSLALHKTFKYWEMFHFRWIYLPYMNKMWLSLQRIMGKIQSLHCKFVMYVLPKTVNF